MWLHRSFESRSWSRKPKALLVSSKGRLKTSWNCMTELVHYWRPFNRTLLDAFLNWIGALPASEPPLQFWSAWKSIARIAVLKEWLVWTRSRWLNRLLPIKAKVESHGWTHPLPHHGQWLQTRCSTWKLRILFGDKVSSLWRCFCGCFCCWITWCTSPWKMKSWNLKFWLLGRCLSSWHPGFSLKKISESLVYRSMHGWNFCGTCIH